MTVSSADVDEATSEDAFLGGRIVLLQPEGGYRAGLDAVLLAAAAPVMAGRPERVLDVGAGVGTVGLCVARRCPEAQVTMIEKGERLAALAEANISRNGLQDRVRVVLGDVEFPAARLAALGLGPPESYAHVLANPPFQTEGSGTASGNAGKAAAHAMPEGALGHWARFLARMAASGGCLTLIHRADELREVLAALDGRFGALEVLPLHARQGAPAHRIIVRGRKGSRAPLKLLAGRALHGEGNRFLPEVEAVLRDGQPLAF